MGLTEDTLQEKTSKSQAARGLDAVFGAFGGSHLEARLAKNPYKTCGFSPPDAHRFRAGATFGHPGMILVDIFNILNPCGPCGPTDTLGRAYFNYSSLGIASTSPDNPYYCSARHMGSSGPMRAHLNCCFAKHWNGKHHVPMADRTKEMPDD